MSKSWSKLVLLIGFAAIGLTGLWLLLETRLGLAQAKEVIPAVSAHYLTYRPAAAGFNISVSQVISSGFVRPVQITHAGDGSNRLFVVEQYGRIRIVNSPVVTPFLDIRGIVRSPEPGDSGGSEEGLLSVAFHPNYESNRFFYIYYTNTSGNLVIARYTTSSNNPSLADPASAQPILTIPHPTHSNHNGGQLMFGPLDGYLYIGTGDGGSGGDPDENAQNKNVLLGKILRINVNSGSPYSIPPDNPFAGATAGADEIWAIGVRNPWRFSFDRGDSGGAGKGDMYIGDVGQGQWEEISYQAAGTPGGVNFGWDCREGRHDFEPGNCSSGVALTDPIAEYSHSLGVSVTGGYVYRGSQYPALFGYYFYADYGSGRIWSMTKTGSNSWSTPEQEYGPPSSTFSVSAFGEDEQGELYLLDYFGGTIRRLADANGPQPNLSTSTKNVSTAHADPGETVTYTIRINNTGGLSNQTAFLTDTLPAGLTYVPGSLSATSGTVTAQAPILRWQGPLSPTKNITLTYRVMVNAGAAGSFVNQAQLTSPGLSPVTLSEAIFAPRPALSTGVEDFFFPGTQPNQLTDSIPDPGGCDFCHTAPIYDKWRGSMMAQSGRDPLLWAALAVANSDAGDAGDYCLRCHTPKGWFEGRSHPADGSALQSGDIHAGVACEICHRMVDPIASTNDQAANFDDDIRAAITPFLPSGHVGSAMLILDPQDRRRGPFALSGFSSHTAYKTDFLSQSTNAVTESRLCGSCHNVDNPALSWESGNNRYWPNSNGLAAPSFAKGELFPIERTYDEWLNSTYATTGVFAPQFAGAKPNGMVGSCQDCHMRRTIGKAAEDIYNPVNRDCAAAGCLPEHDLAGGNTWVPQILQDTRWRLNSAGDAASLNATIIRAREMLQKAATISVTLTSAGANKIAAVRVTNQTGHKLPTGYPEGRRIWLNLKAYDEDNNLIYESGAYNPSTGVLTEDPAIKIYEAKQGMSSDLATLLQMPENANQPTFHFVLNNVILKDNRIPPRGFTASALSQRGLAPVGASYAAGQHWDDTAYTLPAATVRVVATLYYQTASKEYIDFLRTRGGVDGAALGTLWDASKSPPEVMAIVSEPPLPYYFPLIFKQK
ncbi:MAG: hypothetical protein Fur0044_19350 [Anaerolineae bacterium]